MNSMNGFGEHFYLSFVFVHLGEWSPLDWFKKFSYIHEE